jgi:hypothetical protein
MNRSACREGDHVRRTWTTLLTTSRMPRLKTAAAGLVAESEAVPETATLLHSNFLCQLAIYSFQRAFSECF